MSPRPPQKATPWLGMPRGFLAPLAELGPLARLDFPTTGFAYSDASADSDAPGSAKSQPAREPAGVAAAPPRQEPAPPRLVTKALPVTLHGLAAPRGKSVPTFTSAILAASDVQIPLSAALPLRPMIVFGPAPAAPAPAAPKPAPPKPVQTKPAQPKAAQPKAEQPRAEQAKPEQVRPVPEAPEKRVRASVVPPPQPVPAKRPAVPQINAFKVPAPAPPASDSGVDQRLKPRKESPEHQPLDAAAASDTTIPSLRLEATESAWSKFSINLKMGIAAAVIVGISGIAYVVTRGSKTSQTPAAASSTAAVAAGVPISGGWIDDWANAAKSRRHISVLSGSAKLSDYRMEFQAQIETKAIGWIFRGLNPRNYYVAKLETITPGLEPTVALVHFAVVDGQDENRVVVPLPMKVRVDTDYKIRFDAVGNHFTAWVQNEKIAEWTDSRFGSGGVGFFSERDEKAAMQGTVNVVALVPKN